MIKHVDELTPTETEHTVVELQVDGRSTSLTVYTNNTISIVSIGTATI